MSLHADLTPPKLKYTPAKIWRSFILITALSLVKGVVCTANPEVGFKDVDAAFMVGAMPRREGMERKDLLAANVKIFKVKSSILEISRFCIL